MTWMLDRALVAAAARAADPGGIRFTERQLYYETCRVLRPLHRLPRRVPFTHAPPLRYPHFAAALRRHHRRGGVPGLLGAAPPAVAPTASPPEPDLYDYGLPRLLVCQDRAIAGMLLANDWHVEAACPVLAADGPPPDPRLVAALERAAADGLGTVPAVHVLHDASPRGLALPRRIRAQFPAASVRVTALGMAPRHAAALHLPRGRGPAAAPPPDGMPPAGVLTARELRWLAGGRFAEVAAVPPARLLRTLHRQVRGVRRARNALRDELRGVREAGFLTWPAAD